MKGFRKFCTGLLVLSAVMMTMGLRAYAAQDEEYTYTVKLFAGNQGEIRNTGITASRGGAGNPEGVTITYDKNQATVKGLKYGDTVYMNYQDAASVTDERYYVRGVRRSGRDNSEATESTFQVASDRDYVIAYGIKGDMVSYTVNYVDEDGEQLLDSDTYYGNPGEQQYVSARYVDGYQPQSYNLVKTLVSNEAENVFDFVYTPVAEPAEPEPEPEPEEPAAPAASAAPAAPAAPAAATPAPAAPAAATPAAATPAAATPAPGAPAAVGGDETPLPDDATPAGTTDLDNLDDEATPLGQQELEADRPGTVVSYLPVYIGIGIAAAAALAVMAVYLRKKRKVAAASAVAKTVDEMTDTQKNDR